MATKKTGRKATTSRVKKVDKPTVAKRVFQGGDRQVRSGACDCGNCECISKYGSSDTKIGDVKGVKHA